MQWLSFGIKQTMGLVFLIGLAACVSTPQTGGADREQNDMNRRNNSVDIYELGPDGLPIIFWRIHQEDSAAVQALLDAGADIEVRGFFGVTPVIWAAASGQWDFVKFLVERGADLSAYGANGFTVTNSARRSNLRLESRQGQHLQDVRDILRQRGLYDTVPGTAALRAQMAAGTIPTPPIFRRANWPPR